MRNLFLMMYHGWVTRDRGIENAIRVVAMNPNVALIILGNALQQKYHEELKQLTVALKVGDRVLFHSAVPQTELWEYVGAADVGLALPSNVCKNHLYSLPNKFFENIQSLTPVVCADFPEMGRLVREYGIGLTCDPDSVDSINRQIERLRTDRELYQSCKKNLLRAKEELCWEKEREPLTLEYRRLMEHLGSAA